MGRSTEPATPCRPSQGWQDLMGLVELGKPAAATDDDEGKPHEGGRPPERREQSSSALVRLADDVAGDGDAWREYFELEAPEGAPLPRGFDSTLMSFEQLLVTVPGPCWTLAQRARL